MSELLIKNLSKHVSLTDEEINIILSLFTTRKYKKNQFILKEGEIMRTENFIVSGLTITYDTDEKGQEHIIQFGLSDWWTGDMYSFLTNTPSTYNVQCLEDAEVMHINQSNLEQLYLRVPKMERHFRLIIQFAFVASVRRISSSLKKSAAERYQEFLLRYPQIEQRVPDRYIASYLGITAQSLSRIRGRKI